MILNGTTSKESRDHFVGNMCGILVIGGSFTLFFLLIGYYAALVKDITDIN